MNLGVIGSRDLTDKKRVWDEIERFLSDNGIHRENLIIVSGGARGPDTFAEEWAIKKKVSRIIYVPKWELEGKSKASQNRNKLIADTCHKILCFHDGKSTGCMMAVSFARGQNKEVRIIT